jgi:acyl-[acyl-carrier-protein]-phospholipid O-acyltransferase/long-chain-fatty-acid--[acyl-carrier-protein] ligase
VALGAVSLPSAGLALWPLADAAPFPFGGGWAVAAVIVLALALLGVLCWLRPMVFVRAFLWLVTHTVYRVRVVGRENVPARGGALLVCNHLSFIDWLLLLAAQPRFVRFLVYGPYAQAWGLRHLLRWGKAIPIDGTSGPRAIVKALRTAADALAAGELVCIFAEGRVSPTGFLLPFHRGFEQILRRTPVPVIPVCLDQVWGSIFSYAGGKVFWKLPQHMPYPVGVAFGPPLPPTTAAEVRLAIQKLSADWAVRRVGEHRPVHRQFVRMAARHPFRRCGFDQLRPEGVNYGRTLAAAICFARWLKPVLGDEPMMALWLPPSLGAVISNVALAFLRKTVVNLNYTAGQENVQSALRQCGIRHVLTSRKFSERVKLDPGPGVEVLYAEDILPHIPTWRRTLAYLGVLLLPGWVLDHWVLRLAGHRMDDLATVIFSSGSTGEPKGVMLTHGNIAANALSMVEAIQLTRHDRLLGILPFFHSFGYTVTLWAALQVGASAVYYPDPRAAKEIGETCKKYACTIFVTTPTFLRFYLRRCQPDDFASLRLLICGAEKLPQSLAQEFHEKFGVLPLEGYGCTELAPAAAANLPDRVIEGVRYVGNKPGSIGQPLPGVAVQVVNPERPDEVLPPGREGLLLVYGANVMKGYLGRDDLTRQVIRDGWYVTGDMARIDEDGFVFLTGRLSRFAKVGGEMVPLEKVEEELHGLLGTAERVLAVTCVPDEARGERLVVLYTALNGQDPRALGKGLTGRGLPNLWVPGERDFFKVPELPILGSGKLDLKRVKDKAVEVTGASRLNGPHGARESAGRPSAAAP